MSMPVDPPRRPRFLEWAGGLAGFFVVAGILLRAHGYLANRPLVWDECNIALNIASRSWGELLTPLDYNQAAPPLFLLATKLAVELLGNSEYALRLLPFLAGLVSLPLFLALARRCLAPRAVWPAIALLALPHALLFYADESKQYSGDLAVAVGMTVLALRAHHDGLRAGSAIVFALAGAVALWLSHPAAFVLGGAAFVLARQYTKRRDRNSLRWLALTGGSWVASFFGLYFVSVRELVNRDAMQEFWSAGSRLPGSPPGGAFLTLFPRSFDELAWLPRVFFEFFSTPCGLRFAGLAALFALLGTYSLFKTKRHVLALLVLPAILALLASAMKVYPFRWRLILFLVPAAFLLVAEGLEIIRAQGGRIGALTSLLGVSLLLLQPVILAATHIASSPLGRATRTVLLEFQRQRLEGDLLYVYYGAERPFRYYAPRLGLSRGDVVFGTEPRHTPQELEPDLEKLRGHQRVWLFFAQATRAHEPFILGALDRQGRRLATYRGPGESLHLYDMSSAPTPPR
ncbi:MAG: glycosyltransferase family 39 protein [Planctomycetota bacterium]